MGHRVGKLDWAFPGPQLGAALLASDTVALPALMQVRGFTVQRVPWQ